MVSIICCHSDAISKHLLLPVQCLSHNVVGGEYVDCVRLQKLLQQLVGIVVTSYGRLLHFYVLTSGEIVSPSCVDAASLSKHWTTLSRYSFDFV